MERVIEVERVEGTAWPLRWLEYSPSTTLGQAHQDRREGRHAWGNQSGPWEAKLEGEEC